MPSNVDFSVYIIKEILTAFVCINGCSQLSTSLKRYSFCLVHQIPAYFSFAVYKDTHIVTRKQTLQNLYTSSSQSSCSCYSPDSYQEVC